MPYANITFKMNLYMNNELYISENPSYGVRTKYMYLNTIPYRETIDLSTIFDDYGYNIYRDDEGKERIFLSGPMTHMVEIYSPTMPTTQEFNAYFRSGIFYGSKEIGSTYGYQESSSSDVGKFCDNIFNLSSSKVIGKNMDEIKKISRYSDAQSEETAYPYVSAGNFVSGCSYRIETLGDTNWNAVAGTSGTQYQVGDYLIATNVGSGTGKAHQQNYKAGSFITGKIYVIDYVGSTSFTSIGAVSNTVGVVFKATSSGFGSGTAKLLKYQDIDEDSLEHSNFFSITNGEYFLLKPNRLIGNDYYTSRSREYFLTSGTATLQDIRASIGAENFDRTYNQSADSHIRDRLFFTMQAPGGSGAGSDLYNTGGGGGAGSLSYGIIKWKDSMDTTRLRELIFYAGSVGTPGTAPRGAAGLSSRSKIEHYNKTEYYSEFSIHNPAGNRGSYSTAGEITDYPYILINSSQTDLGYSNYAHMYGNRSRVFLSSNEKFSITIVGAKKGTGAGYYSSSSSLRNAYLVIPALYGLNELSKSSTNRNPLNFSYSSFYPDVRAYDGYFDARDKRATSTPKPVIVSEAAKKSLGGCSFYGRGGPTSQGTDTTINSPYCPESLNKDTDEFGIITNDSSNFSFPYNGSGGGGGSWVVGGHPGARGARGFIRISI